MVLPRVPGVAWDGRGGARGRQENGEALEAWQVETPGRPSWVPGSLKKDKRGPDGLVQGLERIIMVSL